MLSQGPDPSPGATASLVVDERWRIAGWDAAATKLLGFEQQEVLGRRCHEVFSCRDLQGEPFCTERCPVRRLLAPAEELPATPESGEFLARDGRGRALQLTAAIGLRPEEAAGHVLILLARSAVDRTGEGAEEPARGIVGRLMDGALEEALAATGADAAEIFLLERSTRRMILSGFRGPFSQAFHQVAEFRLGEGFPGLVAGNDRPLLTDDLPHDARFLRSQVKDAGFRYYLCVPIPGAGTPAGSLHVASRSNPQAVLSHWLTLSRLAEDLGNIFELAGSSHPNLDCGLYAAGEHDERLDLRCLGRFSVSRAGTPLPIERFGRRRALTLLKMLLQHFGRVVDREEMAELMWPAGPPKDADTLVKVAAHYLRRGLEPAGGSRHAPPFIITEANGYAFNVDSFHWLDVREFQAAAERGSRLERTGSRREALAAFRAAAALYTGDYLEEEPYSDWCFERRKELRQTYVDVLRRTARLLWIGGEAEASIQCYYRTLEFDPYLEEVHRDLMDALWRSGRRTEALRQYEVCRRAMREEFDVLPLPETQALYRSIRDRI